MVHNRDYTRQVLLRSQAGANFILLELLGPGWSSGSQQNGLQAEYMQLPTQAISLQGSIQTPPYLLEKQCTHSWLTRVTAQKMETSMELHRSHLIQDTSHSYMEQCVIQELRRRCKPNAHCKVRRPNWRYCAMVRDARWVGCGMWPNKKENCRAKRL